ncbi:Ig-like domain-containing protein [Variovorax paradoxus]|uniref:Ig-like domain-containing protein n=1 Tax=Variovorax paradoxus TaxID=34073 RepID=UPI00247A0112
MLKKSLAVACVATLLSACGGGGGGGGGGLPLFPAPAPAPSPAPAPAPAPGPTPVADTTPPSVVAFNPTASTDVPRNAEISATLSEALLATTVTDSNLRITRLGVAVPGSLNYDATKNKISFAPTKALDLLANYTVTAGTGLKDLTGNGLAAEKSWSFRTADGGWEAPHELEPATATADQAVAAQDGQGNTVVAWMSRPTGGFYEIRTAVQSAGGSWSSGSTLSTPGTYNALFPQLRFDNQGNGLALWMQVDDTGAEVWSSRFSKGSGWQTPTRLDRTVGSSYAPSLAIDADGNAFAVWGKRETQYGNSDIWGARFTPAGGWQAAVRLGSSANIGTYDQAEQPQVAVDGTGNAYVLWVQTASNTPVWVARYQAGSGWQPAVSLGAARLGEPYAPRLAVSSSGQAMALWNSYDGSAYRFDLWCSVLATPGGSWTSPALLENDDTGDASSQAVVADSAGNFHAIWRQSIPVYGSELVHRQYTPGSGWNTATAISTRNGSYQNRAPSLVADRNGNLMALWGVGFGGEEEGTFARRYTAGEGWRSTLRVGATGGRAAISTSLDVQADGSIAATWVEPAEFRSDGAVLAARFK